MSEEHTKAKQLIAEERIEGISAQDHQWLLVHVAACADCATYLSAAEQTIRSLRSISVTVSPTLASRAQFRVRMRARQLQAEPRWRMVWAACCISWAFGAVTAPYVWHGLEWLGHRVGAPKIIWELGFGLWWALPAMAVAFILLLDAGRSSESVWKRQEN